MSNLTIVVDDAVIKQARFRALQDGTSLSAKVREFLVSYAQGAPKRAPRDATADLMRLMEAVRAEAKPGPMPKPAFQARSPLRRRLPQERLRQRGRARWRQPASPFWTPTSCCTRWTRATRPSRPSRSRWWSNWAMKAARW